MSKFFSFVVLCLVISGLVACGGGSSNTPTPTPTPAPTLTVNPSSAVVQLGTSQTFSVTNPPGAVTWSVNGPGTINANGQYIAPTNFPTGTGTATVTATAAGQTGTAIAQVAYPNNNGLRQSGAIKLGTSGGDTLNESATACCIGTLGSLISRGGNLFVLSNNHVLGRSDAAPALSASDVITQPGPIECFAAPSTIGSSSARATLKPTANETTGTCVGQGFSFCGHAPSNVDAAIASINPGTVDTTGSILDLGVPGPTSIGDAPPSATIAAPAINQPVAKSGRTTGLTCSTVGSITTTIIVSYDAACGGATAFGAYFENQVVVNGGTFSAGGDSGSLIVTSDTARPVALLYAGNSTSTAGNPISDVLAAFNNGTAPTIVGGSDHSVSCLTTANSNSTSVPASTSVPLSTKERARAASALEANSRSLTADRAVNDVKIGSSADDPGEAALVVELTQAPRAPIPPTIGGVRTRVVYPAGFSVGNLGKDAVSQAIAVKKANVESLMSQKGIQGVGVGQSDDNAAETAIVIYTLKGASHSEIPAMIGGIRTKVVEGDRFRAFGWNEKPAARNQGCAAVKPGDVKVPTIKATLK